MTMKINTKLTLRTITGRAAQGHRVLDLALAGALESDALEGLAAQWPALRAWMTEHVETTGRLSLTLPETRCEGMALGEITACEYQDPSGDRWTEDAHSILACSALCRGLRLDVEATEDAHVASLRLTLRVPLSSVSDDALLGLAELVAQPVPVEVEVGT
jgi:hypothetical protein